MTQNIFSNIFCGYQKLQLHVIVAQQVQQASWTIQLSTKSFLLIILYITNPMHGHISQRSQLKRGSILLSNPTKSMLETLRGLFPAGTACSLEEPGEKTTYTVYNFQKLKFTSSAAPQTLWTSLASPLWQIFGPNPGACSTASGGPSSSWCPRPISEPDIR